MEIFNKEKQLKSLRKNLNILRDLAKSQETNDDEESADSISLTEYFKNM